MPSLTTLNPFSRPSLAPGHRPQADIAAVLADQDRRPERA